MSTVFFILFFFVGVKKSISTVRGKRAKSKYDIRIVFKLYFRYIYSYAPLSSLLFIFRADNAELIFLRIPELLISHQIVLPFWQCDDQALCAALMIRTHTFILPCPEFKRIGNTQLRATAAARLYEKISATENDKYPLRGVPRFYLFIPNYTRYTVYHAAGLWWMKISRRVKYRAIRIIIGIMGGRSWNLYVLPAKCFGCIYYYYYYYYDLYTVSGIVVTVLLYKMYCCRRARQNSFSLISHKSLYAGKWGWGVGPPIGVEQFWPRDGILVTFQCVCVCEI
jgi:hypothetical protein